MHIELGDQVTEQNILTQCEENYRELLRKIEEKRAEGSPRKPPVTSEG